jgi:hypothetical protein
MLLYFRFIKFKSAVAKVQIYQIVSIVFKTSPISFSFRFFSLYRRIRVGMTHKDVTQPYHSIVANIIFAV